MKRYELLKDSLTSEWETTQQIGRRLGLHWAPGATHGELHELRTDLFRLHLTGAVEHEPKHNGHRWRLAR